MHRYDVFLSHGRNDQSAVEWIARRLREMGLHPFLDEWHLIPGTPWQEGIEEALAQSETVAVFVGPSGISPWHNEQMRAALDQALRTRDEYRIIPVLLSGSDPESLPRPLGRRTYVDFRPGLDDDAAFSRLVAGILGQPPESAESFTLPDEPAPYPGLLPFTAQQAGFFFGRAAELGKLRTRLMDSVLLAVVGASGSGKSSLVLAGLLPALDAHWHTLVLSPGARPMRALADQLATLGPVEGRLDLADDLEARMQQRSDGLSSAAWTLLVNKPGIATLLIVVDQFEELFTQIVGTPEDVRRQQRQFVANLVDAVRTSGRRIRVLLTLRADFVRHCLDFADLSILLESNQLLLGVMGKDALREAIVKPAQAVGAMFEKGLVGRLIDDMEDQLSALPLMGSALAQLWQRRHGVWLTHAAYEEIGGVSGAIDQRANEIYDRLNKRQQQLARDLFVRLVALGEGISDTRRRIPQDELEWVGASPHELQQVVGLLSHRDARLIAVGKETLELAHEALIEQWGRLRAWLEEDRHILRVHRHLTESAHEWEENAHNDGYLYQGARLAEAEEWAELHGQQMSIQERRFLDAGLSLRDRQRAARERLRRRITLGLAAGLTVTLILIVLAGVQLRRAERAESSARGQLLATQGRLVFEQEPAVGLRLILEGWALLPKTDDTGRASIQATLREHVSWGRLRKLGDDIQAISTVCNSDLFVLKRQHEADELCDADGAPVASFVSSVSDVTCSPDRAASHFVVRYLSAPGTAVELRRTADGMRVPLPAELNEVFYSPGPDGAYFVASYVDAPAELRRTADDGLVASLSSQVAGVQFLSPQGSLAYFLVCYVDASCELRRIADGGLVARFTDKVDGVFFGSDADETYFVVRYASGPYELRRTANGEIILPRGNDYWFDFGPGPAEARVVVGYADAPGELRRIADGSAIIPLTGHVLNVFFGPDGSADDFVVVYDDAPGELRRGDKGQIVARFSDVGDDVFLDWVEFVPEQAPTSLIVSYMDGSAELRRMADGEIVDTSPELIYGLTFSPDADATYSVLEHQDGHIELWHTADEEVILETEADPRSFEFSPDPRATWFVVEYRHGLVQIYETATGRLVTDLAGEVHEIGFSADPAALYFFVRYTDAPDELRHMDTGVPIEGPGKVERISYSPDPGETFFVVNYADAPTKLYRVSSDEVVVLSGDLEQMSFVPDPAAALFVVSYEDVSGELRRAVDGTLVERLTGTVSTVYLPPAAVPYFVVGYRNAPYESRSTIDGRILATLTHLSDGIEAVHYDAGYFVIAYTDGHSELWQADGGSLPLAPLGLGRAGHFFGRQDHRLIVWYEDGRAYVLDVDWLRTMKGEQASLSVEKLTHLACEGPLATELLDEAELDRYLKPGTATICQQQEEN